MLYFLYANITSFYFGVKYDLDASLRDSPEYFFFLNHTNATSLTQLVLSVKIFQ